MSDSDSSGPPGLMGSSSSDGDLPPLVGSTDSEADPAPVVRRRLNDLPDDSDDSDEDLGENFNSWWDVVQMRARGDGGDVGAGFNPDALSRLFQSVEVEDRRRLHDQQVLERQNRARRDAANQQWKRAHARAVDLKRALKSARARPADGEEIFDDADVQCNICFELEDFENVGERAKSLSCWAECISEQVGENNKLDPKSLI